MYSSKTPLQVMLDLAIDDGVRSRGHRRNIFHPYFYYVGAWTGSHSRYKTQTVFDFMGSWKSFNYKGPSIAIPTDVSNYKGAASPTSTTHGNYSK